jgi:hypothetical protein
VAARSQPNNRRHRAAVFAIAALSLAALGRPASASAHSGTFVNALDYRAEVTSTGRRGGIIAASVLDGDRRLELGVVPTVTVTVLGDQGEPLLRFSPGGIEVNERSPTAIADRLAERSAVPALDPRAVPEWSRLSTGHRYAWHDHRLGPVPARAYPEGDVADWVIPYVADGRADAVTGRLLHARGPPLWPWLIVLAATGALTATLVIARRRRRLVERTVFIGAALGGAAAVLLSVSFGFVSGRSPSNAWTTVVFCGVVAAASVALFVRAPQTRSGVAGVVALLAALVGMSDTAVLVHGFVVSMLPVWLVRAAVVIACCAGGVAALLAAVLLFRPDSPPRIRSRRGRAAMAIPRGRP